VRKRVFSAAFIFEPGEYDAEFHRLNERIEQAAESMSGFLGAEVWTSTDGKRFNATNYWDSLETLREFSVHAKHLEAKRQYSRWYGGFHIVISEVVRSYGDGGFPHITPNQRDATINGTAAC
jgi:heme-degrading monooxygenase HmoA